MRTTLEFPDDLFREIKVLAAREGTTVKSLVTQYVRDGLAADASTEPPSVGRATVPPTEAELTIDGRHPTPREIADILNDDLTGTTDIAARR